MSFNPWYVGGGVKSGRLSAQEIHGKRSFNPWYVGGGVKSDHLRISTTFQICFNPWYVGGGVKRLVKLCTSL